MRRIGALINLAEGDQESKIQVAAFVRGLQESGWIVGRNVLIDYRWTEGDADRVRKYAAELVALAPDVILTTGGSHVGPLQQATRSVPIVFIQTADPVGGGFVESLARPGGNTTGFTVFEFDIGAKRLELLKEIAPRVKRVAVLRDPTNPSGTGLMGAIQAVAPSLGVEVSSPVGLRDTGEIERDRSVDHWLRNFESNWERIRAIDPVRFDEKFRRTWLFYLGGAAETFEAEREIIICFHIIFVKGHFARKGASAPMDRLR